MTKRKNPHWGTTLDSFLTEEGVREAATVAAMKATRRDKLTTAGKSSRELLKSLNAGLRPRAARRAKRAQV
jgi:hypothetical protein